MDFSDRVDAALAALFVAIVLARLAYGVVWVRRALANPTEEASPMPRRLFHLLRLTRQAARLLVGVPEDEAYVAHRKKRHPGEPVMSYAEFFRERQDKRYARGKVRGCC